jgi:hypothetical protein
MRKYAKRSEVWIELKGIIISTNDHMAKHYYIDGPRGEAKKIALPRDLVVWE